jgi:DNA polymerase III delta prime subunit
MIIGHKEQQTRLKALIKKGSTPHAFLFSGPEKIGKRTVAYWFLRQLNGEKGESSLSYGGVHPDIMEVSPEKKEIQVSQIEEVIEKVSFKAVSSEFKGVVIDQAHLMNISAQNTLLKTLEEPPLKTVIILISEYPRMIIPTITSRVFEINFRLVNEKEIKKGVDDEEAVRLSLGRPGSALEYVSDPEKKKQLKDLEQETRTVLEKDLASRFSLIKKIAKEERSVEFLECLLRILEEKMIEKMKNKEDSERYREAVKEAEEVIYLYKKTNTKIELAMENIVLIFDH